MKSNFRIKTQKHDQNLYIELSGIFDGASAFELTHLLSQEQEHSNSVFIDTERLTQTFAFGKAILDFNLPKDIKRARFNFSGCRAEEIMPSGCTRCSTTKSNPHKCSGNCKNCTCRYSKKRIAQNQRLTQKTVDVGENTCQTN